MAEFTDKEIRGAYLDAKADRAAALALELPEVARQEHVKMAALFRWMNQRKDAAKKLSGRKPTNPNTQ